MRLIKTYLLRLYIDTESAGRICGDLRPLEDDKSCPFMNIDDLVFHLHRSMVKPSPGPSTKNSREIKNLD
jgi:hypothetical protein